MGTEKDDLPSSRSEWSDFFPSVKQRRESFVSESSSSSPSKASPSKEHSTEQNNNTVLIKSKQNAVLAPPTEDTNSPPTKKTVKKVVKRTVSVKKTTCRTPVSSTDFGDGPPSDGCDYIKVCGKWVKMKSKFPTQTAADTRQMEEDAENIPISRSEWSGNISVGECFGYVLYTSGSYAMCALSIAHKLYLFM